MLELVFAVMLSVSTAHAQQPQASWYIVLKSFLNRTQAVLPQSYASKNECEIARVGMGYSDFNPTGSHGKCVLMYGRPK